MEGNMKEKTALSTLNRLSESVSNLTIDNRLLKQITYQTNYRTERIAGYIQDEGISSRFIDENHIHNITNEAFLKYQERISVHELSYSNKDIKNLLYGLTLVDINDELALFNDYAIFVLQIARGFWSNRYLKIISIIFLQYKRKLEKHTPNILRGIKEILEQNLPAYDGKNHLVLFMKDRIEFILSGDGDLRFAQYVIDNYDSKGKTVDYFFNDIELSSYYLSFSYFDDLLLAWAALKKDFSIEIRNNVIRDLLENREDPDVKKSIVAYLTVTQGKNSKSIEDEKNAIIKLAYELVGDPIDRRKWYLTDKYEEYRGRVDKAIEIINGWINEDVMELFYDSLSMDRDRKEFWRGYLKKIPFVKIVIGKSFLRRLESKYSDKMDFEAIKSRCIISGDEGNAILFQTDTHLLVEFPVTGNAFYTFNKNHAHFKYFDEKTIRSTKRLKDTSLPAINGKRNASQGRFIHRNTSYSNGWHNDIKRWIDTNIGVK